MQRAWGVLCTDAGGDANAGGVAVLTEVALDACNLVVASASALAFSN